MFSPYLSSSFFPFSLFLFLPPTTIFIHYLFHPFFVSWFFISSFFNFPHSYKLPLSLPLTVYFPHQHHPPQSLLSSLFYFSAFFLISFSSFFNLPHSYRSASLSLPRRVYFPFQHHPAQNQCYPFCSCKPHLSSPPICSSLSLSLSLINTTDPWINTLHHAPPGSPLFTPPHLLSQL